MTARTRTAMLAGFAVFVAGGAGAVYLTTRDSGTTVASGSRVEIFYAAAPIDVGTAGASALADGRIRTREVAATARPLDAITSPSDISGRAAASVISPNSIITSAMFPAPQTRIGTVIIPEGKRALSVKLGSVQGVSGFAGAGDRIDVYRVTKSDGFEPTEPPYAQLVLQGVEVLNVNGGGLAEAQGQPKGTDLVFLLAVSPADAERLIYLAEFEKMYFDLVPKTEPAVQTPGARSGPGFQGT